MIVVHHLNNSRSQRVLWLLEELGLPYEIKRYERNPATMLAPPELKAVHPLGKSPVITDGDQVVASYGPDDSFDGRALVADGRVWTLFLLLQGLTLPMLIRRLGIATDSEEAEDERALEAVKAKSREAGKAFLAEKRDEWVDKYGSVDIGVFDAFTKRMTRVERDTDEAQKVEDAASRPSYEDLVALSKGWLQVRREQIEVFHLPPYSPELNPDEYLNGDLKRAVQQDVPPQDAQQLKLIAQRHLRVIQRSRRRVRNYFRHHAIRYAA